MFELRTSLPDHELLLAMAVEELAGRLLSAIRAHIAKPGNPKMVTLGNARGDLFYNNPNVPAYPGSHREPIEMAYTEAWCWLENQLLLIPAPSQSDGPWRILSRRANLITNEADFERFNLSRLLAPESVHASIRDRVWLAFARGEYDTAVFSAMKAVEVAVRDAASLGSEKYGVPMVREAFRDGGPLADPAQQPSEREALANLFAGAIGSYKNPHSHRNVDVNEPREAAEIIMLAGHLLRIVDDRRLRLRMGD